MSYEEALSYHHQAEKYGYSVPDLDATPALELIAWAEENGALGDAMLNAWLDSQEENEN